MIRFSGALLVVATIACLTIPARADTEPDLAAVEAHVADAAGARPNDERIEATRTGKDLDGTEVRIRSGDDVRVDFTNGPLHSAYGTVGGVSWKQNSNGQTVLDDSGSVEPNEEQVTCTLTHVREPADLFVISNLNALGNGTKDYVDPVTWHVVRNERIRPHETIVTRYDDFRTTAGYTRAWHSATTDGRKEDDTTFAISKIDTAPILASEFKVPVTARRLVQFPPNVTTVPLPVRLNHRGTKFLVRLQIGGRGFDFLLDTGASGIAIERDVAVSFGLAERGTYSNEQNVISTNTIVPEIDVGSLVMRDVVVKTIPKIDQGNDDYRVVGLLGFDFFDALGAKLDYVNRSVTAHAPGSMLLPHGPGTVDLEVRLGTFVPQIGAAVGGALGTRFHIDTSYEAGLVLDDYFRRRYPTQSAGETPKAIPIYTLPGKNGVSYGLVRLAELDLGQMRFKDFDAYVMESPTLYDGDQDGIIGADLLNVFDVYLDYEHGHVVLTPNGTAAQRAR